ncbi:TetR family transcriptional regulator [Leucobacter sp. USCH14]|uniref:TetR/AcrR family transcriptional regulator n=1 Tax=Leucobacter sp. USCH14 TaxID=3024838 RepID=UPI0030ACE976
MPHTDEPTATDAAQTASAAHIANATPATPAAPRRRDPEGRRRAILTAATEIIVEEGAAALTHRAVAKRASVPLGSTTQYFSSIDDMRECALQQLADEIDEAIARLEPFIATIFERPDPIIDELLAYLEDPRTVHADIALMTSGTTDPRLRALALRWPERVVDLLSTQVGQERAVAIAVFLDGATMHAGLTGTPLGRDELTRVLQALMTMPVPGSAHT